MRFRRTLSCVLSLLMAGAMLCPMAAMAAPQPQQESAPATEEMAFDRELWQQMYEHGDIVETAEPRANRLIVNKWLSIYKISPGVAGIDGTTEGTADVTKSGFTRITMQRRLNEDYAWASYTVFNDRYTNSYKYVTYFTSIATSGYEYRLMGEHYAYRNVFDTEKLMSYTDPVAF